MVKKMLRNKFDDKGCLEMGTSAENDFVSLARELGWAVKRANKEQDINEHWDLEIKKDNKKHKVDVKAMKRMRREDKCVQDKWVWIELHGVRPSDNGWVYGSKADLIAFEKQDSFMIVKRSDLMELIPKVIKLQGIVTEVTQAKYRVYQRNGRPDKISLIEISQLEPIKLVEWKKLVH